MKERLINNWGLKIVAGICAVLLWVIVTNIDDPVKPFTIDNIPIEYLNEESITKNGMTYRVIGDVKTASVLIRVRETDGKKISASDFKATVDLDEAVISDSDSPQISRIRVVITPVNKKNIINDDNMEQLVYSIKVETEKINTAEFTIEPNVTGELEESYTNGEVICSPATVTVSAPESILSTIVQVRADVDISGQSEDFKQTSQLKFLDEKGKYVDLSGKDISISAAETVVSVEMLKSNMVSVDVEVSGKDAVADGCKYINYECDTQSISISGSKYDFAGLDKITIPIDVTGATGDITKTVDINEYLPEGLKASDNSMVTIILRVEKLKQKEFRIPFAQVILTGSREDLNYALKQQDSITVWLKGLEDDLENLSEQDILVTLDVRRLNEPGEYQVTPSVEEMSQFEVIKPAEVTIVVTRPEDESGSPGESAGTPQESGSSSGTGENSSLETEENDTESTAQDRE